MLILLTGFSICTANFMIHVDVLLGLPPPPHVKDDVQFWRFASTYIARIVYLHAKPYAKTYEGRYLCSTKENSFDGGVNVKANVSARGSWRHH
jgi:hypothetical protein